jgi:hypothetical protein
MYFKKLVFEHNAAGENKYSTLFSTMQVRFCDVIDTQEQTANFKNFKNSLSLKEEKRCKSRP